MSVGKRLLFPIPRIFILLFFIHTKIPSAISACPPSSCGDIQVIKYPFRLKTDHKSCGHPNITYFELDCVNNQTVMNLSSGRWFYVKEINYKEYTTRLVDPGISSRNLSSCPLHSNSDSDWRRPVSLSNGSNINVLIAFIHCLSPVNFVEYVRAPHCGSRSNKFGNSSDMIYSYIMHGEIRVSNLEESCTVDRVNWVSVRRPLKDNSSLANIYDGMAYGFQIWWFPAIRGNCWRFIRSKNGLIRGTKCCYADRPSDPLICVSDPLKVVLQLPNVMIVGLKFVIGFLFLMWLVIYTWRRRHLSMDESIEEFLRSQNNLTPIMYTYSEIKKMTNNFNQRLGGGGYGIVYKGQLRSGPYVAVKMMEQSTASEEEFISEVGTIGQIHHVNVVQLIGFCVEQAKYALVYEFLPNGSLDRYIFNQQSIGVLALTYQKMFEIALGVARGISYLHHGCDMQILHFDIKPHNILLDDKFNAKISDFGLAQLHPTDESSINLTDVRGTLGYMAPEMFYRNVGGISYKADVYSFGMLLMELASKRKNMNPFIEDTSQVCFPSWVYDQLCSEKDIKINDATEEERKIVKKIIIAALWCIQMNPSNRPTMNKVVEMIESNSEPRMPPKPFVAPQDMVVDHGITKAYTVDYINLDSDDN